MQKVVYVPPWKDVRYPADGVTIYLGYPYIIGSPRGTGGVDVNLYSASSPLLSGIPVYNLTLSDRSITFYAHIKGNTRKEMYDYRRELAGYLTPFNGSEWTNPGRLYYTNDGGTYWIDAIPIHSPEFTDRYGHYNRVELEFRCPDPFWKSQRQSYLQMLYSSANFEFPIEFNHTVEFGSSGFRSDAINKGQVASPLLIRVSGTGDENPKVTNLTTGEFILIQQALPEGSILEIDTSFGEVIDHIGIEEPIAWALII